MFTMEQIRNISFAVLNQSTLADRLTFTEKKSVKIHNTCIKLDEIDKQIRFETAEMHKTISDRVTKWKEEFATMQRQNEKTMSEHKMRINSNSETLVSHRQLLDENKHMMAANQDLINKIGTKLERARDNLQNEIAMSRDEINAKIDQNDKFALDQMASIENMILHDKSEIKSEINKTNETFKQQLITEIDKLKTFVNNITTAAQAHRETLQEKYNEKLSKIKDVCAQYFSKYEKHLLHQAEMVKALESRQEGWVNTLIKPQEVNQARLFSVDTRIKEGELTRIKDF